MIPHTILKEKKQTKKKTVPYRHEDDPEKKWRYLFNGFVNSPLRSGGFRSFPNRHPRFRIHPQTGPLPTTDNRELRNAFNPPLPVFAEFYQLAKFEKYSLNKTF